MATPTITRRPCPAVFLAVAVFVLVHGPARADDLTLDANPPIVPPPPETPPVCDVP
jgi:hypothetical protein